ncbi:MAG: hypothetical protein ACRDPO_38985 [Streptosporangiaceae bacterium]
MIRGVKAWAEAHMDEVLANREDYDTRVALTAGRPPITMIR